jgi:hypothetical protein
MVRGLKYPSSGLAEAAPSTHTPRGRTIVWPGLRPGCALAGLACAALLLAGCGRHTGAAAEVDNPEVNATLAQLTQELHHTMAGRKINRDFDEFVSLRHLEVPPPPAGKKYAINENWKVVLVNQ